MSEQREFPRISVGKVDPSYNGPMQGVDVVPWVGPDVAIIAAIEKKFGKEAPHNPQFQVFVILQGDAFVIKDAQGNAVKTFDSAKGARISGTKPIGGTDKRGQDLSRNVNDMLISAGVFTLEQIKQFMAAQAAGTHPGWTADELIAALVNRPCYVEVGASWNDDGKPYSNIDNFITAAQYAEKMKIPTLFRQERPTAPTPGKGKETTINTAGALGQPLGNALNLGGMSPLAPASNPMLAQAPQTQQQSPLPFTSVPGIGGAPAPQAGLPNGGAPAGGASLLQVAGLPGLPSLS